jgi:glycosidase
MDWGEVENQDGDSGSLLNLYRKLIRMRREKPALTSPHRRRLPTDTPEVYAFLRGLGDQRLLVLLNFSPEPRKPRAGDKDYFLPPFGFLISPL